MIRLSRVPGPKSPLEARPGRVIAVVALAIGVAVVKPWGGAPGPTPGSLSTTPPSATVPPMAVTRSYDPSAFGPDPPPPGWEIWRSNDEVSARLPVPPDGLGATSGPPGRLDSTQASGGPVIDLGSADDLATIAINRPLDTTLAAVRIWRFRDGSQPERIPLVELPPPWPASHFRVFARRDARLPEGTVLPWRPGLYRLDLLVDPADRIQSLLLFVHEGVEPLPRDATHLDQATVDLALVGRLPSAATLWSYSTYLTGWAERFPPDDCRVTEIWRSTDLNDACHAIPVGRPQALGVNLPDGAVVTSIRLQEVDPLPGPIEVTLRTDVIGRPGLAYVSTTPAVLPDGIHRLDVESSTGSFRWYVEADARLVEWGL